MTSRTQLRRAAVAGLAAIALAGSGIGAVAGATTPARAGWTGSEGSVTGPSMPFPVPVVVLSTDQQAPMALPLHVAATPVTGDAIELRVTDPVDGAGDVYVHWRNLDSGATGTTHLPVAAGDDAARAQTGPGTVVAVVTGGQPTLLPGLGSFAGE